MLINLKVNAYTSRVASVAELRQELAPFASQQFREIWVSMDAGRPSLCACHVLRPDHKSESVTRCSCFHQRNELDRVSEILYVIANRAIRVSTSYDALIKRSILSCVN